MIELQRQDLNDIFDLNEIALGCESIADLQQQTLMQIQKMVSADSSVFFDVNRSSIGWRFVDGASLGVPEEAPKTWCDQYQTADPFVFRLLGLLQSKNGWLLTSNNTVNHEDYVRTDFYRDFLRPQSIYHMMVIGLKNGSDPIGLIGLHRSKKSRAFSAKDAAKVEAFVPYLSSVAQKIKLTEMLTERHEIISTLTDKLYNKGVITLNNDFAPVYINENAQKTLKISTHLGLKSINTNTDILPAQIYQCCKDIKKNFNLSQDAQNNQSINFTIEQGTEHVTGYIYAYEAGSRGLRFMVCFDDKPSIANSQNFFSKFNLTRREIDITHLVSTGMTNHEIANDLCISVRTVQNHLRSIYDKVQVHNRTSLVSRLMLPN